MNPREEAAWELHQFFKELDLSYAIIGGVAVQIWGQPRLTIDVDLTVVAPLDQPSSVFIQQVLDRFPARLENALDVAIIRRWLKDFADLLDNPEIIERFERPWQRIHPREQRR